MRSLLVLVPIAFAFCHSTAGWEIDWSDEIEYTGLPDTSDWNFTQGRYGAQSLGYSAPPRPENYHVRDGSLIMMGRKEHDERQALYSALS